MGHIKKLKLTRMIGNCSIDTEVEGALTQDDLAELIRLSREPSLAESETDEAEPEGADCVDSPGWQNRALIAEEQFQRQLDLIDAARGAAGLLCDRFGIEHGANSQAHKLIKQAMGRVVEVSDIYERMSFELGNLRGALVRLGFADAPAINSAQPADKYCAVLGHHIDLAKRQGVTLTQPTNTEGLEMTRDQRMAQLKALFQSSQRAIFDLAVFDGYVTKDMEAKQAMAEAMRWAVDQSIIDTGERKEAESAVEQMPATGGPPDTIITNLADQLDEAMAAAKPPDVEPPIRQFTRNRRSQLEVDAKKLAERTEREGWER